MTGAQFRALIREVAEDLCEINETKGREYAGEDDALAFFHEQAQELGLSLEQGWGVLARKHWRSLTTFVKEPLMPLSEPIEGRAEDLILYSLLFIAMQRERAQQAPRPRGVAADAERVVRSGETQRESTDPIVRRSTETRDTFVLFKRFLRLGPDRTIGKLGEGSPVAIGQLGAMADEFHWHERATEYDALGVDLVD
jgi:hypothetical protein